MSATDEVRLMLTEAGVKWKNETAFMQGQEHLMTTWKSTDGKTVAYSEFEYPHMKKLRIYDCTPAQAIAATLGASERESYDAGFASGVKATLQQLYGLLHEYPTLDEIEAWADSQWEEYE